MNRNRSKLIALAALLMAGGLLLIRNNRNNAEPSTPPALAPRPDEAEVLKKLATPEEKSKSPAPVKPREEMSATAKNEFRDFTDRLLRELPKTKDLQSLPAQDAHSTPPAIREAAVQLGQVAELLSKNPELKPEGLDFYEKCSLTQDYPNSVRALCLNRALRLHAELHQKVWEFNREKIPAAVIELSKKL
jgi:hypothetical protein